MPRVKNYYYKGFIIQRVTEGYYDIWGPVFKKGQRRKSHGTRTTIREAKDVIDATVGMNPKPHTAVKWVGSWPKCNFCSKLAKYDGKTIMGPWGFMCETHFRQFGVGLGLGRGQKLLKNPIHPQAVESLKRYKGDIKAGHLGAAEFWRGQAGAYFTANPFPKSRAHKIFRVSDGKLMFAGNKQDAIRIYKKLGGTKAGYMFFLTMSETMPKIGANPMKGSPRGPSHRCPYCRYQWSTVYKTPRCPKCKELLGKYGEAYWWLKNPLMESVVAGLGLGTGFAIAGATVRKVMGKNPILDSAKVVIVPTLEKPPRHWVKLIPRYGYMPRLYPLYEKLYKSLPEARSAAHQLKARLTNPLTRVPLSKMNPLQQFCCTVCGACAPKRLLPHSMFEERMKWLRSHYSRYHKGLWGRR